jgi:hypothetical protein
MRIDLEVDLGKRAEVFKTQAGRCQTPSDLLVILGGLARTFWHFEMPTDHPTGPRCSILRTRKA